MTDEETWDRLTEDERAGLGRYHDSLVDHNGNPPTLSLDEVLRLLADA